MRKVNAARATIADSGAGSPTSVYSTKPSEAAIKTMQIATKIVEIRIIESARPGPSRQRSTIADSTGFFLDPYTSAGVPLPTRGRGTGTVSGGRLATHA